MFSIRKIFILITAINCWEFRKKKFRIFASRFLIPKDHHSLLQLYLDGPKDKIFHYFQFQGYKNQKLKIKTLKIVLFFNNKTLSKIKELKECTYQII